MLLKSETMFWRIINSIASLKLAITIFVTLAILLIASTWLAVDPTNGALRKDFYRSWWFNSLLGLLALNVICVVVARLPRLKIWSIGFVTAHLGVLIILFGAMLSNNFKIYGYMSLREGGKANFIELEDERELTISLSKPTYTVPIKETFDEDANMYEPSQSNKVYHLTGSEYFIKLEKFLPNVDEKKEVVESDSIENPAVELEFKLNGETQGGGWFFPSDKTSIGPLKVIFERTSEHLPDALELESNYRFGSEFGDDGLLNVWLNGQSYDIDVKSSLSKDVPVGEYRLMLKKYEANFKAHEGADSAGDKSLNPAVIFELKNSSWSQSYIAFANNPDIAMIELGEGHLLIGESVLRIALAGDGKLKYISQSKTGKKEIGLVKVGDFHRYKWMPFDFQFGVKRFYKDAEVRANVKEVEPEPDKTRLPALNLTITTGANTYKNDWLTLYDTKNYNFNGDTINIAYKPKRFHLDFDVTLEKFAKPVNPGTTDASSYESSVIIEDGGDSLKRKVSVNWPLNHKGYLFYQSSYVEEPDGTYGSVFAVSYDPGKNVVYVGFAIVIAGTLMLFYLKPFLKKRLLKDNLAELVGR